MELNLKYKQYNSYDEGINQEQTYNKPYQEIIDYFEKEISNFNYENLAKILHNVKDYTKLNLNDGTRVEIGVMNGIINVGVFFTNGTKFIGCYSNIVDNKEFAEKIDKVPRS